MPFRYGRSLLRQAIFEGSVLQASKNTNPKVAGMLEALRRPSRLADTLGVSPSAARALPCRAVRADASAPPVDGRHSRRWVALAAVRAVWQPSGASSWVRP